MPPARLGTLAREPHITLPRAETKDVGGYGVGTAGFGLGSWGLTPGSTGIAVTPLTALGVSTAWACVKRGSEDMGKLPRRIMRRRGRGTVPAPDHPLNRLLRTPNPWQSPSQFWAYVTSWYLLRGNSFVAVLRGEAGEPVMLLPLSPDRCSVCVSPSTGLVYYQITHPSFRNGASTIMARENVMHFRTAVSFDGYTGVSPIAAGPDVFGIGIAAQQHGAVVFRQGTSLSGVITHPAKLNREARNYLRQEWNVSHSGVQNAQQTAVLDEGMKFEPTSMTNEDAQLLQSRQFSVTEICRMFSMPPHKVQDLSRAHFANMEQQNLDYITDTLTPIGVQQEEECLRTLFYTDELDQYSLSIDYEALLKADRHTRYATDEIGIRSGRLTPNEARIADGREPNVPNGDEYQTPMNMQSSADLGSQSSKPDPIIEQDEKPEPEGQAGDE